MRRTEEKEIDGLLFEVTQLPPKRSQALLLRVLGLLSGAAGKAIAALATEPGKPVNLANMDLDFSKMGEAIPALFAKLTPSELESIQKELLATCFVTKEGTKQEFWPVFDHVIEEAFTPLKLTLFAWEVNYGNFSTALAGRVGAMMKGRASPSPSPSTSPETGTSGG